MGDGGMGTATIDKRVSTMAGVTTPLPEGCGGLDDQYFRALSMSLEYRLGWVVIRLFILHLQFWVGAGIIERPAASQVIQICLVASTIASQPMQMARLDSSNPILPILLLKD